MVDIDNMDLEYYIALLNFKQRKEEKKTREKMDSLGI